MPPTLSCTATFCSDSRCTRVFPGIMVSAVLGLSPAQFELPSLPQTLSCTATFCAGGRCTTEDDAREANRPGPCLGDSSRLVESISRNNGFSSAWAFTSSIRVAQPATDSFVHSYFLRRRPVYYRRRCARGEPSGTLSWRLESPG
jgi:hypothetical protein